RQGHLLGLLPEGPGRSAVEGRQGLQGVDRLDGQVPARRRQAELVQRHRVCACLQHGGAAQGLRRQSHPRERHEAGGEHGLRDPDAAARDQGEDLRGRLRPGRGRVHRPVQRQELGAAREDVAPARATRSPLRENGGSRTRRFHVRPSYHHRQGMRRCRPVRSPCPTGPQSTRQRDPIRMLSIHKKLLVGASLALLALSTQAKEYGPGVTDTEIKIGNIMPYSGPASAYGTIGKATGAYFDMVNDKGGINGRKINYITYDDGYSPPRAVEQARKLVEQDEVLLIMEPLGTPSNTAIHKYMNSRKVPQLFVATGASKWNDPKNFPWTMGWQPNYHDEGAIYARHILQTKPDARIGILYQND